MSLITESGEIKSLILKLLQENDININLMCRELNIPISMFKGYLRRKVVNRNMSEKHIIPVLERFGVDVRIQMVIGAKPDLSTIQNKKKTVFEKYIKEEPIDANYKKRVIHIKTKTR